MDILAKFTEPYGDVNIVGQIKEKGIKIGIVTGAPSHIMDLEIGMLGEENFDAVVSAHTINGITPKPHPHGLEECLNLLDISKDKAMYVGNADEDILTARNAGVFDVLIDRKEHEFLDIKSFADYLFSL